ncbi:hypothetical protein BHE90_016909 [Fusarium euwallaceae]|uniref:Uncharacterized protein n=1 Tax=Fusarium euwallaceae TaxID=1147111 RepID=A0A430KZ34_9HYPO|nr:hypothetical protein BHE90_016909 [Fusarium euwallaceae]
MQICPANHISLLNLRNIREEKVILFGNSFILRTYASTTEKARFINQLEPRKAVAFVTGLIWDSPSSLVNKVIQRVTNAKAQALSSGKCAPLAASSITLFLEDGKNSLGERFKYEGRVDCFRTPSALLCCAGWYGEFYSYFEHTVHRASEIFGPGSTIASFFLLHPLTEDVFCCNLCCFNLWERGFIGQDWDGLRSWQRRITYFQGTAQTIEQGGKEKNRTSAIHGFGSFSTAKEHSAEDQRHEEQLTAWPSMALS